MDKKDKKCDIYLKYPKKSTYEMECFDSTWEKEHALDLEKDPSISKWTRKHGIRIPYFYEDKKHYYIPDFLVEFSNGDIEIQEVKQGREVYNPIEQIKFEMAIRWCDVHCKFNKQNVSFKIITRDI